MKKALFFALLVFCLTPWCSSAIALLLGMALSLTLGNPFPDQTKKWTPLLLQFCVMGLGGAMDLAVVGKVGLHGMGYTLIGITFTMAFGIWLGKRLQLNDSASLLLSSGTAICGGSAIAAVSSTIRARSEDTAVALATVFFLNATALLIFPPLGHFFGLTEDQFGLWAALAIHDTSSVVGASLQYGPRALEVATTVKLARALWIIPLAFAVGLWWSRGQQNASAGKAKKPWFILGFVAIAALVTYFPVLQPLGKQLSLVAKRGLVVTLFLIGCGLSRATIKNVGAKPFLQGFILWVSVASLTLGAILKGWIS